MDLFTAISFFGGLALFLYGMTMLGSSLERVSGGKLERTLEKLTNTVWKGVLLGAVVTAGIQASAATTVIVVGLVNARMLKLRNAIGVIMGANIGTTMTAHILRLADIESSNTFIQLLNPSSLAPIACIIGAVMIMAGKRSKYRDIGTVLLGFGILFTGMLMMSDSVSPLAGSEVFKNAFTTFANIPVLGILTGAVVTAILQSSSVSVGILQALSTTGVVTAAMAFPVIMGQNIGKTVTPAFAAIGASKNAKRVVVVHVAFNILGTVVFLSVFYLIHALYPFAFWNEAVNMGDIANFHSLFNISITLLFMPFVGLLERIARAIVPDKPGDAQADISDVVLDERLFKSPALAIEHARDAVMRMALLSEYNLVTSVRMLDKYEKKAAERLNENENTIDKLQDRIENYLLHLSEHELTDIDSQRLSKVVHISGEFERIADHADNILEHAAKLHDAKLSFSRKAMDELTLYGQANAEAMELAIDAFKNTNESAALEIMPLEEIIDDMEDQLREKHMERLRRGKCTIDAAFPFIETLRNLERVGDLCSNIAESVLSYDNYQPVDRHEYKLKIGETPEYKEKYSVYKTKYVKALKK